MRRISGSRVGVVTLVSTGSRVHRGDPGSIGVDLGFIVAGWRSDLDL